MRGRTKLAAATVGVIAAAGAATGVVAAAGNGSGDPAADLASAINKRAGTSITPGDVTGAYRTSSRSGSTRRWPRASSRGSRPTTCSRGPRTRRSAARAPEAPASGPPAAPATPRGVSCWPRWRPC